VGQSLTAAEDNGSSSWASAHRPPPHGDHGAIRLQQGRTLERRFGVEPSGVEVHDLVSGRAVAVEEVLDDSQAVQLGHLGAQLFINLPHDRTRCVSPNSTLPPMSR
jgi:hypothetical protein